MRKLYCSNAQNEALCGTDCFIEVPEPMFDIDNFPYEQIQIDDRYVMDANWAVSKHKIHETELHSAHGIHTLYFCSWACEIDYGLRQLPPDAQNELLDYIGA